MSFNSWIYLLFLAVVVTLYWLFPASWRKGLLLVASYLFYGWVSPWLCCLLFAMSLASYLFALGIDKSKTERGKKTCLVFGVIVSFAALFCFKYLVFTLNSVFTLLGWMGVAAPSPLASWILPVGLSFYTFQCVSYLVDVRRGSAPFEKNFATYLLFLAFFPQLVAGPIERANDLLPSLKEEKSFDGAYLRKALPYLLLGFFKKVAIADYLAPFVNRLYAAPESSDGPSLLLSTVLFGLEIYGDFSGYCDIAVGSAELMGVSLTENFNQPYLASNIKDFWRRWHISLTRWFTDYVYIPMGGSHHGKARTCLNILIVFLLSGLWHGANWTFVLWGTLHGLYLVLYTLVGQPLENQIKARHNGVLPRGYRFLGWLFCLLEVTFAWIFFRSSSLAEVGTLLSRLPLGWGSPITTITSLMAFTWQDAIKVGLLIASLTLGKRVLFAEEQPAEGRSYASAYAVSFYFLGATLLSAAVILAAHQESQFIYFNF